MINFGINSTATSKQIKYINGLFSTLKRKNINNSYLTEIEQFQGKSISWKEASEILNNLEKIRNKHNELDFMFETGDNQVRKSEIFDVINQRNHLKTISNIVIDWNQHVMDANYGSEGRSMLIKIPLNLSDLTQNERDRLDVNKKYFIELVVAKANWDIENDCFKQGLIYKVEDKIVSDVSVGKYVTINNDRFIVVGLNLKHKQWKRIVDENSEIVFINDDHTATGKIFEYHGKFWNSLSDVVDHYHKTAVELLNWANKKLNNIISNIGVFEQFINLFEYTKEEIKIMKQNLTAKTIKIDEPPPPFLEENQNIWED